MTGAGDGIVIRPIEGLAERKACVALQETTWGDGFADRVPASVLMIAEKTGGVVSGAFDGDRLVAFVFGLTGWVDGRPLHWSDMLAVHPDYRGRGLGYRLKLHQREALLERGVDRVVWTADPLVARNAHINFNRLGATAREYRRDVYGQSTSPLHSGIGTDRLLVEWELESGRVLAALAGPVERRAPSAPVLNPPAVVGGASPRPSDGIIAPEGDRVRVAIPADIQRLKARDLALAVAWRTNVRQALEGCFERGYAVAGLERDEGSPDDADGAAGRVCRYVLVRDLAL